jgi:hypothetical protein
MSQSTLNGFFGYVNKQYTLVFVDEMNWPFFCDVN